MSGVARCWPVRAGGRGARGCGMGRNRDGRKPIVGKRSNLEKGRLLNEIGERGAV